MRPGRPNGPNGLDPHGPAVLACWLERCWLVAICKYWRLSKLQKLTPGKGGEIHITDAIQLLINENETFIAHNFSGKYLDCGSMEGYIKSNFEISKL